jgi:phage-related minor tail protein
MMMSDGETSVRADIDTEGARAMADTLAGARAEMTELSAASRSFGVAVSTALKGAASEGKAFDSVLKTLGLSLAKIGADAVGKLIASSLTGLAQDTATAGNGVTAFAKGGVVSSPQLFAMPGGFSAGLSAGQSAGLGLMGESGAEAIIPLARGADGRLGVRADGNTAAPVSVVVNVATADAASFRRSEAFIASMLARAVDRGRRMS